jgi:hypothetical protein
VTPSSDKEVPSDVAIHIARDGAKGSKNRCKQHPQGAMTTTNHYDGSYRKEGGSGMGHVTAAAHGDKRQVRPATDHFRRLLVEVCLNHAYPIRHNLKDCDMMKSFMISGSFTRGKELNEHPSESDTILFPKEDAVMTVHSGCLLQAF